MTKVRWTQTALGGLESIHAFIARESPGLARQVIERLVKAVEILEEFPESGRVVPERGDPAFRELVRAPYRVIYEHVDGIANILTVFHSARRLPDDFDSAAR